MKKVRTEIQAREMKSEEIRDEAAKRPTAKRKDMTLEEVIMAAVGAGDILASYIQKEYAQTLVERSKVDADAEALRRIAFPPQFQKTNKVLHAYNVHLERTNGRYLVHHLTKNLSLSSSESLTQSLTSFLAAVFNDNVINWSRIQLIMVVVGKLAERLIRKRKTRLAIAAVQCVDEYFKESNIIQWVVDNGTWAAMASQAHTEFLTEGGRSYCGIYKLLLAGLVTATAYTLFSQFNFTADEGSCEPDMCTS